MGFHKNLNEISKTLNFPLDINDFSTFINDIHELYDESWCKKGDKVYEIFKPITIRIDDKGVVREAEGDGKDQYVIEQVEKNSNRVVNRFSTYKEASKATGINAKYIEKVCDGKQQTTGGFKWNIKYKSVQ